MCKPPYRYLANQGISSYFTLAVMAIVISLIQGCVTETRPLFNEKVNYEKALEQRIQIGLGYLKQGDIAKAKRNMARALEIDSKSPAAHAGLALVFQEDGEPELAKKHFTKALSLDSSNTQIRDSYGEYLFTQKRYDDALREYKRVVKDSLYENRSRAFYRLGVCQLKTGALDDAEASFLKVMQMTGYKKPAAKELANLYLKNEQYAKAKKYYDFYTKDTIKTPADLWLGFRLERVFGNNELADSYAMALKNLYPYSQEYIEYRKMFGQ